MLITTLRISRHVVKGNFNVTPYLIRNLSAGKWREANPPQADLRSPFSVPEMPPIMLIPVKFDHHEVHEGHEECLTLSQGLFVLFVCFVVQYLNRSSIDEILMITCGTSH
jgi:hypothetical protein